MDNEVQQIGDDVFRRRYRYHSYQGNQPQTLAFPKEILSQAVHETAEFAEQEMLYYYLTWTCKMQLIDGEFRHYHFKNQLPNDIAIFNTELHQRASPHSVLYVVAVLNRGKRGDAKSPSAASLPKWRMVSSFVTAEEISAKYTIDEHHLPQGSRQKRHFFKQEIENNGVALYAAALVPPNWRKVQRVCSQKRKNWIPQYRWQEVESAIDSAMKRGRAHAKHSEQRAPLIPILHIDMNSGSFFCESLLPIQIQRSSGSAGPHSGHIGGHWAAVSLQAVNEYQSMVHKLYVDVQDIIQKATLVDPNAARAYQWLYAIPTASTHNGHHNGGGTVTSPSSASLPAHSPTSHSHGQMRNVDVSQSLVSHVMGAMEAFKMSDVGVSHTRPPLHASMSLPLEDYEEQAHRVPHTGYANLAAGMGPRLMKCSMCKELKHGKKQLEQRVMRLENENLFKDVRIKALEDELFKVRLNPHVQAGGTQLPVHFNGISIPITPPMPSIHDEHSYTLPNMGHLPNLPNLPLPSGLTQQPKF